MSLPFGVTRTRVASDHALLSPDGFVKAPLPGWTKTAGIVLISPAMGANFSQYFALMEPGATSGDALPEVERVAYVVEGEVSVRIAGRERVLTPGGWVFVPPQGEVPITARTAAKLNVFEKPYVSLPGVDDPAPLAGQEQDVKGEPFLGDPDAVLKVLLPTTPEFDLAVNVFAYRPGATLPQVETHVMEHGLLMLDGAGVYRLSESWYPVQAGDVIWMAPYCPQWFVAMGKTPARYLYYKDVNRDPLEDLLS
jgi:(S)-ureidoglycine aminohydrolase